MNILFSFSRLSFHFVDDFLCCAKNFSFDVVHLFIFSFVSLAGGDMSRKNVTKSDVKEFMPMVSSRSFTVSGLTFKFLIHLEFILLCGVRKGSSVILLHVSVQFCHTIY